MDELEHLWTAPEPSRELRMAILEGLGEQATIAANDNRRFWLVGLAGGMAAILTAIFVFSSPLTPMPEPDTWQVAASEAGFSELWDWTTAPTGGDG